MEKEKEKEKEVTAGSNDTPPLSTSSTFPPGSGGEACRRGRTASSDVASPAVAKGWEPAPNAAALPGGQHNSPPRPRGERRRSRQGGCVVGARRNLRLTRTITDNSCAIPASSPARTPESARSSRSFLHFLFLFHPPFPETITQDPLPRSQNPEPSNASKIHCSSRLPRLVTQRQLGGRERMKRAEGGALVTTRRSKLSGEPHKLSTRSPAGIQTQRGGWDSGGGRL